MNCLLKTIVITVFTALFVISCKNHREISNGKLEVKDSLKIISKDNITITLAETLTSLAREELKDWTEYGELDKFLVSYYSISKSNALLNAKELVTLVKQLKDTIRIEALHTPSVLARINVLENEALRLEDMASISTIDFKEVSQEVNSIIKVYEAFKAKINAIYKARDLQENLEVDTEKNFGTKQDKKKNLGKKNINKAQTSSISIDIQ